MGNRQRNRAVATVDNLGVSWSPTEDELRRYLGADCGELAAICELRPKWIEVVRHPGHEASQSEWEGPAWIAGVPTHHVAVRAPHGIALDIRGFSRDSGWTNADEYTTRSKIPDDTRDVARRLLAALGA